MYLGGGKYETRTIKWQGSKTATRDVANRELARMLDAYGATTGSSADKTVAQLVARWWRNSEADWAPGTRAIYECYLRLHVLPTLGSKKLHDVHPEDLDDLYAALRKKGLAPASVRKVHVIIRRAFADAVRLRWVTHNPAVDAQPPTVHLPDIDPPSAEEIRLLLARAQADDPDLYVFLAVAADTGARRGEVCGLRWSDVDLDVGELVIARSVALDNGGLLVKSTKTHQARRVALGGPAVAALRTHHGHALERAQALHVDLPADAYVFSAATDFGQPWRPDSTSGRFVRLRSRCGCEKPSGKPNERCKVEAHQWMYRVRLHDLRHALITDWFAAGVDDRTIMGRVGHASLQTLTRYAHFRSARDREAADRLGDRHQVN